MLLAGCVEWGTAEIEGGCFFLGVAVWVGSIIIESVVLYDRRVLILLADGRAQSTRSVERCSTDWLTVYIGEMCASRTRWGA